MEEENRSPATPGFELSATRTTEKLRWNKHLGGFAVVTYLVHRAPGLKQVTDRAGVGSRPTSLLRDLRGGKTAANNNNGRTVRRSEGVSRGARQVKA